MSRSALLLLLLASSACPKPPNVDDAGPELDAGSPWVDAGTPCRFDDDCAYFQQGRRCNLTTGTCDVPAKGCNFDSDCSSLDQSDYCFALGTQCRCVIEGNDAGFPGVCRLRRGVCDPCTDDVQCGSTGTFDPQGACKSLPGDSSGLKYCLQHQQGACGCGMVPDGTGFCAPQSNSCAHLGCTSDISCPALQVCNSAACLCEPSCSWNFQTGKDTCPAGKVCWVDHANLDPNSAKYGAGRCRAPCSSTSACTDTASNPYGGSRLKCDTEALTDGGASLARCRANGPCMDNHECPTLPGDSTSLGYCDRASFSCKTDCREGVDPTTGQSFADCRSNYTCKTDAGVHVCTIKGCADDQRGARLACRTGQLCCGEDKNGDGVADPCPPASQLEANNCYDAPRPPFCTVCATDAECENYAKPSWLTCANGASSPSCSKLPSLCAYAGDRADKTMGVNLCMPSTFADVTRVGLIGRQYRGCPAGYTPIELWPQVTAPNAQGDYCKTDADCRVGNSTGVCAFNGADGGSPRVCKCHQPGQPSDCPRTTDGGVTSVCLGGAPAPSLCVYTEVCLPPAGYAYRDGGAGCGL